MPTLRVRARITLSSVLLCSSCALDTTFTGTGCDGEGAACTCETRADTVQEGSYVCSVGPLTCLCSDAGSREVDATLPSEVDASDPQLWIEPPPGDADTLSQVDAGAEPDATASADGAIGGASPTFPDLSKLPQPTATCPDFREGWASFAGSSVRLWVGSNNPRKLGPLVFYWHGAGSDVDEAATALGAAGIAEIKQRGGIVAAFETTTLQGTTTGAGTWYTGDFSIADEVLACALAKNIGIDTSHIHAVGFGAGGLQTSWMAYARSSYLASVVSYSGGITLRTPIATPEDSANVVAAMMMHGAEGIDRLLLDYALTSVAMVQDIRAKGGFALDCDHGGEHVIPEDGGPAAVRFLMDHAYLTKPSPYLSDLPAALPDYCKLP